MKVCTVLGTRPEIIRLSRIIPKFDNYFEHLVIHTGQNFDKNLNDIFFDELKLRRPDIQLNCAKQSSAKTISQIISSLDELLDKFSPDAILILGDTDSGLASIVAKRKKIPIFHMEAGNRCFNQNVPEEVNRKIIDTISDINLPYSKIAKSYLVAEGFPSDRIIVTGSPLKEVFDFYESDIEESNILNRLKLNEKEFIVFSAHRAENVDDMTRLHKIMEAANFVSETLNLPCVFSVHPRTKAKLTQINDFDFSRLIMLEPLGYIDYMKLQLKSKLVLSDSGSLTEEAAICGFKAINLRDEHERPEGFEEAAVMFTGLNLERIQSALLILEKQSQLRSNVIRCPDEYKVENVSEKVARIILSYSDYVNRTVWKKY